MFSIKVAKAMAKMHWHALACWNVFVRLRLY